MSKKIDWDNIKKREDLYKLKPERPSKSEMRKRGLDYIKRQINSLSKDK